MSNSILPKIGYSIAIEYSTPSGELTAEIKVSVTDKAYGTVDRRPIIITRSGYFEMFVEQESSELLKNLSNSELDQLWFEAVRSVRDALIVELDKIPPLAIHSFAILPNGRTSESNLLYLSMTIDSEDI